VTDGNALFPLARAIYGELKNENRIPELLIVGIGYPPEQSTLISDLRGRDLTPYVYARDYSPSPQMSFNLGTGGAPKFVRFIREQLKPTIDARYTTIPGDAAHFGHSLGGLFCLYTLFQEPALFNRFVAASPSIWWANTAIFGAEGDYAASHRDLPARLFIGAGREEGTEGDDITKMADVLRQRAYPGLQVSTQVFEGQAHGTMVPYCLSQGLRAVY
jgi:predicted alpha/beta superfamily hydrolase